MFSQAPRVLKYEAAARFFEAPDLGRALVLYANLWGRNRLVIGGPSHIARYANVPVCSFHRDFDAAGEIF